jgi:hypothetical protein
VRGFFVGEVFLFVLRGIVDPMTQVITEKRSKFLPPELAAAVGEFNRSTEICEH